ncbi:hypothetical protein JVU11DRAFT_8599 [Chiua virens]|nr:hypothetical protein JVU11DRAFT_8599 [Chiua virens]
MFGKSTIFVTALALAAAALAYPGPGFKCPVGSPQCCHSWRDVGTFEPGMMPPPGLPGFDHGMPDGLVGFACKTVDDGMTCGNASPLCCKLNDYGGILTFGCTEVKPAYYPPKPYYPPQPTY